jgi:hypothetical protein
MVASEFGAFPQRYVISMAGVKGLKAAPNSIWDLVAGEDGTQGTQAGQFQATDLKNYLDVLVKLTADIGIISRTPRHYFFSQGGDPSGEALIAMEAPLTKKVEQLEATLEPTWRELAAFLLLLDGAAIDSRNIVAEYDENATVQPMTSAIIVKTLVEAGRPLANVYRDMGWSQQDLDELANDQEAARIQDSTFASAVMDVQQRNFDRGDAI